MEYCIEFLEICRAAQRSGLYCVPVSRHLTAAEIAYLVLDRGARVLVLCQRMAGTLGQAVLAGLGGRLRIFIIGELISGLSSWTDSVRRKPATPVASEVAGTDLLYSSGTAGRPEGVRQALSGLPITTIHPLLKVLMVDMMQMPSASICLSAQALYRASPLRFSLVTVVFGGIVVAIETFDAEYCLRLIELHRTGCRACAALCMQKHRVRLVGSRR